MNNYCTWPLTSYFLYRNMSMVRWLGGIAIILSFGCMMTMLIFIPSMTRKMANIQSKLRSEMATFNVSILYNGIIVRRWFINHDFLWNQVVADDAWKELMVIRKELPNVEPRKTREAGAPCSKTILRSVFLMCITDVVSFRLQRTAHVPKRTSRRSWWPRSWWVLIK